MPLTVGCRNKFSNSYSLFNIRGSLLIVGIVVLFSITLKYLHLKQLKYTNLYVTHATETQILENEILSKVTFGNYDAKIRTLFDIASQYVIDDNYSGEVPLQQQKRLENMEKFCSSNVYKEMRKRKLGKRGRQMILVKEFGVAECIIPKTGTSTRGEIFWQLFEKGPIPNRQRFFSRWPCQSLGSFMRSKNSSSSFPFQYLISRAPFDRALSGYFDKITRRDHMMSANRNNMTINEFFEHLVQKEILDHHYNDQISVCDPCLLNLTFIGRTESLSRDMDYIINKATRLHEKVNFTVSSIPSRNKSKLDPNSLKNLTLETVLDFVWKYRHDYMAFGYDPRSAIKEFLEYKTNITP